MRVCVRVCCLVLQRQGYWGAEASTSNVFYKCPIPDSCVPGSNHTPTTCAPGYYGTLCSVCLPGYYEQFGKCVICSSDTTASAFVIIGIVAAIAVVAFFVLKIKHLLPIETVKIGVSMVQIIASANSTYDIPWPQNFGSYINGMKVFLVDVISLTKANCASPMSYYGKQWQQRWRYM